MNNLTIIAITLNEEGYIGNLLSDLASQIHIDKLLDKVLVVDGGSTDNTKDVVNDFKGKFPVSFVSAPKKGWAQQKNYGVSLTDSENLLFLDADLRLPPTLISNLFETQRKNPNSIVMPRIGADSPRIIFKIGARLTYGYFRLLTLLGHQAASDQCFLISKHDYLKIGGLDESLLHAGDLDFMLRAKKNHIRIKWAPNTIAKVSMRRFESVGTARLLSRYIRSEIHRMLNKGKVKKDYVGYTNTDSE